MPRWALTACPSQDAVAPNATNTVLKPATKLSAAASTRPRTGLPEFSPCGPSSSMETPPI